MFLRFFHNPLLLAKLAWYEYLIKGNKKQSTAEYKIKRIIQDVTGEKIDDIVVYNCGLSTPKLAKNGFQATAIYLEKYNELLVIFRGTELDDMSDWFYNYTGIVSGENTSQIDSAFAFLKFLKKKMPNFDTCYKVAAGHSLGGHLAITVELLRKTFQRVYTYNTALPQLKQLRKYDKRDNKYKIFEVNVRQGRSNYSVTAVCQNIAKILVDDLILKKDLPLIKQTEELYWHLIPNSIVFKYVKDDEIKEKVRQLIRDKKESNTFDYPYDLKGNIKRSIYVMLYKINHIKKYIQYMKG